MKKYQTLRHPSPVGRRLTLAAVLTFSFFAPLALSSDALMQVFLQGSSANELAELVTKAGGRVTHSLHIIDAVGAKLTEEQFGEVIESPHVARFIDDLADSEIPGAPTEEEDAPPCRVRGHIELDFIPKGISWKLYNKYDAPASLNMLKLDWPDALGKIDSIRVGETPIDPALFKGTDETALSLTLEAEAQPVIAGMERLVVTFSTPIDSISPKPLQRDFKLEAGFVGPCTTDLVPGYENNHEDYYYNTAGGVDELHKQGITGKGVTVAVIDSGLWEHELLRNDTNGKNRLLATYDAITDTEGGEALDESGHGTHMTSIIANSGKTLKNGEWTGTYKGVAPDANIVAVKVLDREGLAHLLDIVRGVQWVVDNRAKHNIRIANLSFSKQARWKFWFDPINMAITTAWDQGLVVLAAGGNMGPSISSVGSPGNVPQIITVGLVTDSWTPLLNSDDYIPDFSAQGPTLSGHVKPDIVALGAHMTGLIPPLSVLKLTQPEDILGSGEFVSTGTSQAAAFTSGVVALMLQLKEDATPEEIKCILTTSAEPALTSNGRLAYTPFQQGFGYLNIERALLVGDPSCHRKHFNFGESLEFLGPVTVAEDGSPIIDSMRDIWPTGSEPYTYVWGLKEYVESYSPVAQSDNPSNFVNRLWLDLYQREKAIIESILETE